MGVAIVNSPAVLLYDANGVALAVQDGVAIPASTPGLLIAGSDGTNARIAKVTAAGRVVTDGSEVTQPISAAALPLPAGAATSANQTTGNGSLASILAQLDVALSTRASQTAAAAIETILTAIRDTAGIKKITDQLPAGTNNIGDVDVVSSALPTGAATSANQTTGNSSLASILAQLDVALSTRASQTTAAAIETILTAIRDTAGIKKITDQLPTGTNTIGKTDQGLANTAANRWPIFPTDGTNNMPMLDAVARAGFFKRTDGTNVAPTMDVAARAGFQKVTDGTNTMPTGDAIARAIYHLLTDGTTGPVAVKAASTAPVAADKSLVVVLSPNQQAIPVTTAPANSTSGNRSGYVALGGGSSGSFNALRATTYNEQTSNATRSIGSGNANDTSAGTGARTVEITYYDSTLAGPFTTTVTLNGVTAVATSVSDICFIEKMEVKTCGSNGSNVGTLTLYVNNTGGGGTIGTIAVGTLVAGVGDNRTLWAQHYVPSGKTCSITAYVAGASVSTTFLIRTKDPTSTTSPEVTTPSGVISVSAEFSRNLGTPAAIIGPSRIVAYGIPSANNATLNAAFDFFEV